MKNQLEERITELMFPSYLNIAGPIKSLPILRSPRKSLPWADNLQIKISSARAAARRDGFFAGKLSTGGDFFKGRSYNETPAADRRTARVSGQLLLC